MDDQTRTPDDLPDDTRDNSEGGYGPASASSASTPDMDAENPAEGAVPPGYDWPTHGGYLGCLLAMMPACLVAGFLGSTFIAVLNKAGVVPPIVAGILVVSLFIACALGFGRIGWILGRRFYRKYPRGAASWGEDDSASGLSAARGQHDAVDSALDGAQGEATP